MKKETIICFGDSITQSQNYAEGDRWTARLAFLLDRDFPGRFEVLNKGVGGNTTALALDRLQTDVLPLLPATVLIEFGINDAYVYPWCRVARVGISDYQRNLDEIAWQVRARGGTPVLLVNHFLVARDKFHPQGNGKPIDRNLASYNRAARQLALKKRIPCVDLPRLLKREGVLPDVFLSADGVHLSAEGNHLYARLIAEELKCLKKR
jgi:lysophospholipase L1-like esterase